LSLGGERDDFLRRFLNCCRRSLGPRWKGFGFRRATTIGAWLVHGKPEKGCVLLLHGNGGSRGSMLPVMEMLAKADYTVLAISLRAHGDSTGEINDIGWSARHDVVAAVNFLQSEFPGRSIRILGRSLGAAAAVFAAKELDGRVAGYFLEHPYKDLRSAVWNRVDNHLPPVLNWVAYGGLRLWAPVFLPVELDRISLADRIVDIPAAVPIVIITGSADRHARVEDVKSLFQGVESHAKLVIFEGAAHESLDHADPELYRKTLFEFLASAPELITPMTAER
jgi:alpha-beta hydrolase superfamily lysophospholipase